MPSATKSQDKAVGLGSATVINYTSDLLSYFGAADLVVSMAGYNTVTELLALGKPAILIPRTRPTQEQWMRATRMERLNWFSVIHPDQLTMRTFLAVLRRALAEQETACVETPGLDMNALEKINDCLIGLLHDRASLGWNQLLLDQPGIETGEFAAIRRTETTRNESLLEVAAQGEKEP